MIHLLLLAATLASAEPSSGTVSLSDRIRIDSIEQGVGDLLSGKPTITGKPVFQNGICFGTNATCQTTAASTSSTNTWSGANTFTSSVTVGAPVYTTTATFQRAVIGSWFVVASTNPSLANAVTFTNLTSTATYRMHWTLMQNTSNGGFSCWFFGDNSSTNYKRISFGQNTSGTARTNNSAGANYVEVSPNALAAQPMHGWIEWQRIQDTGSHRIMWTGQGITSETSTGLMAGFTGSGHYIVSALENQTMSCLTPAGTWTGKIWIEAMLLGGGLP